jgi:hypothetical protein
MRQTTWTFFLFFWIGLQAPSVGEIVSVKPVQPPKGFYCTANAWRVYRVLPKETDTVEPIASTHRVIEQSRQNLENDGNGKLAVFKPSKDGEFFENLEFNNGYAVIIHALSAPNGSVNFVIKLVARVDGKVTNILGEHREIFRLDQKDLERVSFSANIPNIEVSNTYLRLETSMLQDKNYDKLALSIQKGQLTEGSITEVNVECSPE